MKDLTHIETKGDVTFWKDAKGKQYQKIGEGDPFRVKDGEITHKKIESCEEYNIRYNNNGVYGFGVFMGSKCLEDNMWTLDAARRCAKGMIYYHRKHWESTNPSGERV